MSDIVEFIRARLDDDETAANSLPDDENDTAGIDLKEAIGYPCERYLAIEPARLRRDVASRRQILDLHPHRRFTEPLAADSPFAEDHRPAFDDDPRYVGCTVCDWDWRFEEVTPRWWCKTVRLLAAPYSDHPDYRQEWTCD